MSLAAASAELHASRRWMLTMAILALFLLGLWSLVVGISWFTPGVFPAFTGWERGFFLGFYAQLTLFVFAALLPFLTLLRYAASLFALRDGDRAMLERALELNARFWRQCAWLMWGMVWLFAYALIGAVVANFVPS